MNIEKSDSRKITLASFENLLDIMDNLREKCPWDKKQTIESLRHLTIEETYELSEAIIEKDFPEIRKELGDILLHIVFYSRIASEQNKFDINDVIESICEKLINRHPHIYGNVIAESDEEVKRNWEQLKLKENGGNKTILGGVPKGMPSMIKAMRIQEKAKGAGFDWEKKEQVWEKVEEEIGELKKELTEKNYNNIKVYEELGDVFFSLINYSRFLNINPEDALENTNRKFIKRFNFLESESKKDGKELSKMSLAEMNQYWERAKQVE